MPEYFESISGAETLWHQDCSPSCHGNTFYAQRHQKQDLRIPRANVNHESCQYDRVKANGLRFWLRFFSWQDLLQFSWPDGPFQRLRRILPVYKSLGYHITLTLAIAKTNGVFYSPEGNTQPSAARVEELTGFVVRALKNADGSSMVDEYQLLNEIGHGPSDGYWPVDVNIRTPLHYVNTFYIPMAKAIRANSTARIHTGSTWAGGWDNPRRIRTQLFEDLIAATRSQTHLLPDGFDIHEYGGNTTTVLQRIQEFRAALDSEFTSIVRGFPGRSQYRPLVIMSEWNCGKQNPATSSCLREVFTNPNRTNYNNLDLTRLVDQAYYYSFYNYGWGTHLNGNFEVPYRDGVNTLNSVTPIGNTPPTATLWASSYSIARGQSLTLSASATDSDGIARVDFINSTSGQILGSDTSSPYQLNYSFPTSGTFPIVARATDGRGASTTTNPISIQVFEPITGPTYDPSFSSWLSIYSTRVVEANNTKLAVAADSRIRRVEYFSADTNQKLGESLTGSLFSIYVTSPSGTHRIRAVPHSASNTYGTSNIVSVTVNGGPTPPSQPPSTPTQNSSLSAWLSVYVSTYQVAENVKLSVAPSAIALSRVEYRNRTTNQTVASLAAGQSDAHFSKWIRLAPGFYDFEVVPFDQQGRFGTSNRVQFTVR